MEDACKSTLEQEPAAGRSRGGKWRPGQSGNPRGRRPGPVNAALLRFREVAETEALPVLREAIAAKSLEACRIVVSCALPRLRPVQLPETMPLPETESPAEAVRALVPLVAEGKISLEAAACIKDLFLAAARIEETTQLRDELEALRAVLEARPAAEPGRGIR